jgi:23S rRNA pseudouridine1911/1915/1917 synthase
VSAGASAVPAGRRDDPEPLLERRAGSAEDGVRVDVALAGWLAEPRARAQERLVAREVTVDGEVAAKSRRLRAGDLVRVARPPAPVPPAGAPPPVPVRYQDEHLLVVAKPAGLVVHAGAGYRGFTLVDALQAAGVGLAGTADPARPGIVHRLDRGTSGLLVVAKTDVAHAGLTAMLRGHDVERGYWALVEGVPAPARATIDAPIGRSARHRTRFAVDARGRPARTHYDVEAAYGRVARVRVRLETGRTHQVRVHLSSMGHPVAGDAAYGASPTLAAELGLRRPALHAYRLCFRHPVTGAPIACDEPLPADLLAAEAILASAA